MQLKEFKEAYNTAIFTTGFVIFGKKDITSVYHDEDDGAWQFFSNDEFDNFGTVAKVVCLGEIIEMVSTVLDLADLQEGYFAQRNQRRING